MTCFHPRGPGPDQFPAICFTQHVVGNLRPFLVLAAAPGADPVTVERLPQKIDFQLRQAAPLFNDAGKAFQQPFNITNVVDMLIDVEIPISDVELFFNLDTLQYGQLAKRVIQYMLPVHGVQLPGKTGGPDRAPVGCIDNDPGTDTRSYAVTALTNVKVSQGKYPLNAGGPGVNLDRIPPSRIMIHFQYLLGKRNFQNLQPQDLHIRRGYLQ